MNKKIINRAISHLRAGYLIIYPTDTSYGLGALFSNKQAVANVFKLKNREDKKKLSVIVPGIAWVIDNLELSSQKEKILRRYLPGKYTFIFKKKYGSDSLGVRIPKYNFAQMLAKKLGEPLTATSANISGQSDCYSLDDLQKGILRQAQLFNHDIIFFDVGELKLGERSTVVDLTQSEPKILRYGSGEFKFEPGARERS